VRIALNDRAPDTYHPESAIVLYRTQRPASDYQSAQEHLLAMRHPIRLTNSTANTLVPTLGPGTFVTASLINELNKLVDQAPLRYIPENVVAVNHTSVAWYEPAATRTMLFDPASDDAVRAFNGRVIPHPPLLFIAGNRNIRVFALPDDRRPTGDVPLLIAPFWNVFREGVVCLGSMPIPKSADPSNVRQWTDAFFNSYFTHLNGAKNWAHPGTYAELLRDVLDAGAFKPTWLKRANTTVERAICGD
jgi:PRTRC genetic system protein B